MSNHEVEQLQRELEQSRRHIADLESRLAADRGPRDETSWLYTTLDNSDIGIWDWDIARDKVTWSETIYRIHQCSREEFDGSMSAVAMNTLEEDRALLIARIEHSVKTREPYTIEYRIRRPTGEIRWVLGHGLVLFNAEGQPYRMAGTAVDVTARRREAAESLEMQQRIIDAQREALRELGAPIIPLADQTLAVPLIGLLTPERAAQVSEVLLNAVRERAARIVLLDVTGVPGLDISTAQALVSAALAVRLLGAQVVLTGIRPQVAQILVELGIDLRSFVIKADLQSGIEYAARARGGGV